MAKYKEVHDIIVFGSYVKGRPVPRDIDLALIADKLDLSIIGKIRADINDEKVHLEFIQAGNLLYLSLFKSLLAEGYSIKKDKPLKDVLGIRPKKVYFYNLKEFNASKKVQFSKALNKALEKIKGDRVGAGAVAIPIEQSSYFEDFLDVWELKYKTKEWTVI